MTVAEIPPEFIFTNDPGDVLELHSEFPDSGEFDSFFLKIKDGEYSEVWGMRGIIPYHHKILEKIR